jgi:TonB family protein
MPLLLAALAAAPPAPAPAPAPTRAVPTAPLSRLIGDMDYPAAALRAEEQGNVRVALDVAADGRVTGCTVVESSRSATLDSATCRILTARARFTPARDAAGEPTTDRFETALAWRLNAPQVPPAIDDAMRAWTDCVGPGMVAGVTDLSRSAQAAADKAFAPCVAQENFMLATIGKDMKGPWSAEDQRATLRAAVLARIEAGRAARKH